MTRLDSNRSHPHTQSPSACRFAGLTAWTRSRHGLPMGVDTFSRLVELLPGDKTYSGRIPTPIIRLVKPQVKAFLTQMDQAVQDIRAGHYTESEPNGYKIHFWPASHTVEILGRPITFQYVNNGQLGGVYMFKLGDKSYALKIYNAPGETWCQDQTHGSSGETLKGLTLVDRPIQDLSRFHFGNPKLGWNVYQWISPEMDLQAQKGLPLTAYPAIKTGDLLRNHIYVQGGKVLVDHGCYAFRRGVTLKPDPDHHLKMAAQKYLRRHVLSGKDYLPMGADGAVYQGAQYTPYPVKMHVFATTAADWLRLAKVVLPYLRERNIMHQTVHDIFQLAWLNIRDETQGKAFTIQVRDQAELETVARDLRGLIQARGLVTQDGAIQGSRALDDTGRIFVIDPPLRIRFEPANG